MAIGTLGMMGIGLGVSALSKFIGGKQLGPGMLDPRQFRDQLTLSEGDLGGIRQGAQRRIQASAQPGIARARTMAAGGAVTGGAALDAIRGITKGTAQATAGIEPQLQDLKRQSEVDYYQQLQRFEGAKEGAVRAAQPFDITPELGVLSKALVLYRSGLLGGQGQGGEVGTATGTGFGGF